jgi:hypothetical protein
MVQKVLFNHLIRVNALSLDLQDPRDKAFHIQQQPEPVFVNVYGVQESIPRSEYASLFSLAGHGTTNRVLVQPARKAENRFLDSLKDLQIRAQLSRVIMSKDEV